MTMTMARHQTIVLSQEDTLSGSTHFICGRYELWCLAVNGIHAKVASVDDKNIPMPSSSGVVLGNSTTWDVIQCKTYGISGSLKLFVCPVDDAVNGPLGICTNVAWGIPHWGHQTSSLPGLWFIPLMVPAGDLEFKVISKNHDQSINWEPQPFVNKYISVGTEPEIIVARWNQPSVDNIYDVPHYKRVASFYVSVHPEMQDALANSSSQLILTGVRDQNNKYWLQKNEHVQLRWSDFYQTYIVQLTVAGYITKIHFSIAIVDEDDSITHVDEFGYNKIGLTYRILNLMHEKTIYCDNFVEVCPKTRSANSLSLGTSSKSIHDIINTPRPKAASTPSHDSSEGSQVSPSRLTLYRGMIVGCAPSTPAIDLGVDDDAVKGVSADALVNYVEVLTDNVVTSDEVTVTQHKCKVEGDVFDDCNVNQSNCKLNAEGYATSYVDAETSPVDDIQIGVEIFHLSLADGDQSRYSETLESKDYNSVATEGVDRQNVDNQPNKKKLKRRLSLKRLRSASWRRRDVPREINSTD